jgi:glycosyltransferase involved in cell wall biosynthesis
MGDPLVSILTTVLNRVETMGPFLASIAGQTYRPIEHIVVDGGSTDGTLDLLREYRASSLRLRRRAQETACTKPSIGGS